MSRGFYILVLFRTATSDENSQGYISCRGNPISAADQAEPTTAMQSTPQGTGKPTQSSLIPARDHLVRVGRVPRCGENGNDGI